MSEAAVNSLDLEAAVEERLDDSKAQQEIREEAWEKRTLVIGPEDCTREVRLADLKRGKPWPKRNDDDCVFDTETFLHAVEAKYRPGMSDLDIYSARTLDDIRKLGLGRWRKRAADYVRRLFGQELSGFDPAQIRHTNWRQNALKDLKGISIFRNLTSIIVSENPLETLEGIEALQELEHFSMGLIEPAIYGRKLRLTGLDRLPKLKSMNFSPVLSGGYQNVDLQHWETVQVLQNLHDRGLLYLGKQFDSLYMYHCFKGFVTNAPEESKYVAPESAAYDRLIRKIPKQLETEEKNRRFGKYKAFMHAIGFNVPFAKSFDDYGHVTETVNTIPSLNLTAFVEDTRRHKVKFVKLYRSKSACERDVRIQKLLAGSGLVNDCDFVDLKKRGIDEIADYSRNHGRQALASETVGTCLDDKVTIALDGDGGKFGYGLVTPFIRGGSLELELAVLKASTQSCFPGDQVISDQYGMNALLAFVDTIDAVLALQDYANAKLQPGAVPIRNYKFQHQQLFLDNAKDEGAAKVLFEAMDPLYERLAKFMSDKRYVSFVHGDFHARNIMTTEERKKRIFDFERSGIGLKVEDLVRLYIKAQEYDNCWKESLHRLSLAGSGKLPDFLIFDLKHAHVPLDKTGSAVPDNYCLRDLVRDRFFRKAFGENYDSKECAEMFALVTAHHYISAMADYDRKAKSDPDNSKAWIDRKDKAAELIADCLSPYLQSSSVAAIIKYLHPTANLKLYSKPQPNSESQHLSCNQPNQCADRVVYAS